MKWLLVCVFGFSPCASVAEEANRLQDAASPYLLQHQFNPVDWYPWGAEALDKARADGKPIFVSVGYSSCHWCHVMADESFEDEEIAALLNEHFVSIKIDRESRPDLDEQFMLVTQLLTGSGGRPNSVFLTPEGDPFFAGGYFPPDVFEAVVTEVANTWRDDAAGVRAEGAQVAAAVRVLLSQRADVRAVTQDVVSAVTTQIADGLDPFTGGYGVAPKFPREPLFLFLLDEAERTADPRLLRAVTDMLDGMILGGIHDHVGGGFHRYAVDAEWHVPHFEKMLYTQALTGRLLLRAWRATGEPRYRRAAVRTFDYVLREMRDPGGGFYSAQDAVSDTAEGARVEGAFYTWTPGELEALRPRTGLAQDLFGVTPEGDLDGASVLHLRALPSELAGESGIEPAAWTAVLDELLAEMFELRRARPVPFVDRKIVVSWNAAMIETLAEAADRLDRPDYYQAAETAARFILDEMRNRDGLARVFFEGTAGIPGQLPDYAALGLALLALHDFAPDRPAALRWRAEALDLTEDLRDRFGTPETGYRMTETPDGLGAFIPVEDTELPSGNALALTLFARLAKRGQVPEIELDAHGLAAALSGHALQFPDQRGYALKAIRDLQAGETGPVRFIAKGTVRVEVQRDAASEVVSVDLAIADGWHINAHEPREDYLVPTAFAIEGVPDIGVRYPDPIIKSLTFNEEPLALYEGELNLIAGGVGRTDRTQIARLTLQACSDTICLQPEELSFTLWER